MSGHSLLTPLLLTHLCLFRQLSLSNNRLCGVWVHFGTQKGNYNAEGINAIADALRVNGALTKLSLARNKLEEAGTKAICEAIEQNTTLKELDISDDWHGGHTGGSAGAKHVAQMLRVNGTLTSLKLRGNQLGDKGWGAIFAAICGNKDSKIMSLNAASENIGPAGGKLIAEALRTSVTSALTRVNVRGNNIEGDVAMQLSATVLGNLKIEMFNEIPIKEMRANSFTELDLKGKLVGVVGGMVVAGLIPIMGALTVANLLGNELDAESAKMLAEVAKQKGISLCGIQRDQTTADFSNQNLKLPDAILLASDLSQADVTGALTSLNLSSNNLCSVTETGYIKVSQVQGSSFNEGDNVVYQGKEMIVSKAIDRDGDIKMRNLPDMSGLKALANALRVNGALTKIRYVSPRT